MTEKEFVDYIGPLAREDMKKTGVLASVTAAQAILESAFGTSELAQNAHNLFGMKASLSGNNWSSEWDGQKYAKKTKEWDGSKYIVITADFRKYKSDAQSIKDHSDYLRGAKKGTSLRYAGLVGETNSRKAAQIIKDGGYATSPTYVDNLCRVIERWGLEQFNAKETEAMNIIKKTATHGMYTGHRDIKYLVIHYTAGVTSKAGSARATASWFANPQSGGTADFIVDDAEIVQYNPDPQNYACWAVGGGKYNNRGGRLYGQATNKNCISIEICSCNKTGKVTNANDGNWYFTDAAVTNAVELAKYLMAQYGISADRVIRHYDVNGKPCPGIHGWNEDTGDVSAWNAFKARLGGTAPSVTPSQPSAPASQPSSGEFKYKVNIPDLRIRKTPNGDPTGSYTGKGIFTITETSGEWGKLKSGAGWIYLGGGYGERVGGGSTPAAPAQPSTFQWEVTVPDLRIRQTPGGTFTGKYTGKGRFTIVEQSNGWGKLKSGAGWISLDTRYGHRV